MDFDTDDAATPNMFDEPEGYFKPEATATLVSYQLVDGSELKLRLVGYNPLWVRIRGLF
jgi:EEF1A N-terminal glycine/lysine methyltransferase